MTIQQSHTQTIVNEIISFSFFFYFTNALNTHRNTGAATAAAAGYTDVIAQHTKIYFPFQMKSCDIKF